MTMVTYTGKQQAESGLYLRTTRFAIKHLDESGPLPGSERDKYYRVPTLLALVATPLAGLAFVIFIPLVGIAMALWLLGDLALQYVGRAAANAVRVVRPSWAPSLAFLSRNKPSAKQATDERAPDAWEEKVEKKLEDADRHEP
jgi:hypothetical protein